MSKRIFGKNRWASASLAAIVFSMAFYLSAESQSSSGEGERRSSRVKTVEVGMVEAVDQGRTLHLSGVTRSSKRANLAFVMGGRMLSRSVEIGDVVRRGQMIARLDDLEPRNAVATAKGNLAELLARKEQTDRDYERVLKLSEARAATDEELEQAGAGRAALKASVEAAEARLEETERRLRETRLTAPFDGTVTEVLAEPGEFVRPGVSVVAVSGSGQTEMEVQVPESVVWDLEPGQAVRIRLPAGNVEVAGTLRSVGQAAAGPGSLFPVVASLEGSRRLVAGMTAELILEVASSANLSVPVEAVVNPGGRRPALFRLVEDRVEKVPLVLGSLIGDRVTVQGERLAAGDRIVVGGQRGLLDGERVQLMEAGR